MLLAADDPRAARAALGTSVLPSEGVFRLYHASTLSQTHLYVGDAAAACAVWREWWPEYKRAKLAFLPLFKLDSTRGHALALAALGDKRSLDQARRLAKRLKADHVQGTRATRENILGCVAARRGRRELAVKRLAAAADAYEEAEMKLHAAACWRGCGVLDGQPRLVERAEAVMREERITRPARWAAMFVPLPARQATLAAAAAER